MYTDIVFVVSSQGPSMERKPGPREVTGPAQGRMAVEGCEGPFSMHVAQVPSPTPQRCPRLPCAAVSAWHLALAGAGPACPSRVGAGGALLPSAQLQPPEGGPVKSPLVPALSLRCWGAPDQCMSLRSHNGPGGRIPLQEFRRGFILTARSQAVRKRGVCGAQPAGLSLIERRQS